MHWHHTCTCIPVYHVLNFSYHVQSRILSSLMKSSEKVWCSLYHINVRLGRPKKVIQFLVSHVKTANVTLTSSILLFSLFIFYFFWLVRWILLHHQINFNHIMSLTIMWCAILSTIYWFYFQFNNFFLKGWVSRSNQTLSLSCKREHIIVNSYFLLKLTIWIPPPKKNEIVIFWMNVHVYRWTCVSHHITYS